MTEAIPHITIDGPSGVGKGNASLYLAKALNWHYLDSGAIYRLLAYQAQQSACDFNDINRLVDVAQSLDVHFEITAEDRAQTLLNGMPADQHIHTEDCAKNASIISKFQEVRAALVARQKAFLKAPGLIADGRDMGTFIFPDAPLKLFLTASAEIRAQRRYKELIAKGICVKMRDLLQDVKDRDARDQNRAVNPLKPAKDAIVIDTGDKTIAQVNQLLEQLYHEHFAS